MLSPQAVNSGNPLQIYADFLVLILIIFFVARRIYRAFHGRRYRSWRIYFFPIIYALFTFLLFLLDYRIMPYYVLLGSIFLASLGFVIGYKYGEKVYFYYRGNNLYYKRSPVIISIWIILYFFRLLLIISNFNVDFISCIIDMIIAMATGMLIGEALNISKKKKEFVEKNKLWPNI